MNRKHLALLSTLLLLGGLLAFGPFGSGTLRNDSARAANAQNTQKGQAVPAAGIEPATPDADYVHDLLERARQAGAVVLSNGDSYDDFASVAQTSDGTLYAAYTAFYDGHDQVRLHRRLPNGRWSTRTHVPLVRGEADIWMPQLAVDADDNVWLVWCEQTGQSKGQTGNWDLYARPFDGDAWGPLVRLTDDPKPDINPHVCVDADRNIHVVWQAHPDNNGDIQYCKYDGKAWSKPRAVTSDAESDWYPHCAVDKEGTVWIAFDSYRNGDYDVFLTNVKGKDLGFVVPIATSSYYEAHPSVACTPDGRVWVAWEQGGYNWGKDQGYWLRRSNRDQGTSLGNARSVKVACWADEKVWAAPDVAAALPEGSRNFPTAMAELAAASDGRLWLRFRHLIRARRNKRGRFRRGWTENVTWLSRDGWKTAETLPASPGRISVFSRILPLENDALAVAYSADARSVDNYHRPIHDTALFAVLGKPAEAPALPELAEYEPPAPPAGMPKWNNALERKQVAAIRDYRAEIDGKPHRIVRGDLHRHSELSWDVGPGNDGSYLDFYRYMIDVAAMDFGGLTDHQGGGQYAYWWWLSEKAADMYYLPPRFVPLYGYERSVRFPNGHRNVFHAYRGVPVFAFQLRLDQTGVFPGVGTGAVLDNDTKLLYEYLHRTGGLCLSHTSGTSSMGTDWRDNDPVIEPVVEIYQGCRNSYEALGAPRVHDADAPPRQAPGGFQKAGMVWKAYEKGYRLGTTASSDHGSTHISFSMVYTPENDRQAILDSMRKRHTYGATDNLIVDFRVGSHFMGDDFKVQELPKLTLKTTGTSKIVKVDLIRNNEYVYTTKPGKNEVAVNYVDMEPQAGTNLYYFRLLQDDGQVAWSSPVWVEYPGT